MKTQKGLSFPRAAALGYAVALLLTVLLSAGAALLLAGEQVGENRMGELTLGVLLLASAAGTAIAGAGEQRLPVGLTVGCLFLLTLLLMGAVFFGGKYDGVWAKAGVILAGTGGAVLLAPGAGKSKKKKHRKKRTR